tara:strand:- start:361 stop:606 length:246 start_codon:yes stop_codon:yes gene_type:complete
MVAKEKAEELVNKFIPHTRVFHEQIGWEDYIDSAKQCALIAVDEIIDLLNNALHKWHVINADLDILDYWQDVKNEITKWKN